MTDTWRDERYIPETVPASDVKYLDQQSQYGNRIGWGDNPALLVVDMTVAFIEDCRTGNDLVESTRRLLDTARSSDIPVFYTVPGDTSYPRDYPVTIKAARKGDADTSDGMSEERREWLETLDRIPSTLEPREDELVIEKPRASAFFDTHLANHLHHYDIDTLVVAGMTTSGCVRSTVVDGHSSNFRMIVPSECVGESLEISHEISLFDIDSRYGDVTSLEETVEQFESFGGSDST